MPTYKYTAKSIDGKKASGKMDAANEKALQQTLKSQGLYLISISKGIDARQYKKLTSKHLAEFCREMSSLLASGVTLVRALDIVTREEGIAGNIKEIYIDIMNDVKRGIALSEAMENRKCFPDLMLGMIRSGEGNGNMDVVMERLAIQFDRENHMSSQVKSAMTYPAVLLVLCVVIVAIIVTYVLPQFDEMFSQMESLPLITEWLLSLSGFLKHWWYLVILAAILAVVLIRVLLRIPPVRNTVDYIKIHMPVVGKLNKVIYTARFARTLSSLYSGGMPISYAVTAAAETIGNVYVCSQFEEVAAKVRSGIALSQALRDIDGLLNKLSSTILVGEESGRLDYMLDSIAMNMETESEAATKRLITMLEPAMIVVMALLVGLVVVAIMLPIYQSYGTVQNSEYY